MAISEVYHKNSHTTLETFINTFFLDVLMNAKKSERFINSNELLISKIIETRKLAEFLSDTEFSSIAIRMLESGKFIKIIVVKGKTRIIDSYKSSIRYEPYSNYCERRKIYARFLNNLPIVLDKYPHHQWYSVTLAIRNCEIEELRKQIHFLNDSFKRLIAGEKFSRYFQPKGSEYGNAGYFKRVEVSECTYDDMMCRAHLHILFHFPPSFSYSKHYISNKELLKLWLMALNNRNIDYKASVKIKKIGYKDINEQKLNLADFVSYITKHDINLLKNKEFTVEYIKQIHNEKFLAKSGTLRNITRNNNYNEIEIDENDIQIFKYQDSLSKYKISE